MMTVGDVEMFDCAKSLREPSAAGAPHGMANAVVGCEIVKWFKLRCFIDKTIDVRTPAIS
jgi:hypothetical protein